MFLSRDDLSMDTYTLHTDEQLAVLLGEGNRGAFTEIYNRYKGILFVHAFRRLEDRAQAEDVLHDLFAALWAGRTELHIHSGNLGGYLYAAIRNRILKSYARDANAGLYISSIASAIDSGTATTDHRVRENQLRQHIEKEIALLPEKMREVFILSRTNHLSHKEIAGQLGLSEKTVKNHINHALKLLRKKLGVLRFIYLLMFY
ncbi:RNA polymerase sigma factor [Pseudobacter ginsenosidimutans]|nr:RNA polymerase sigma-70 factor [Pseudobacter ginsenosidimutans]